MRGGKSTLLISQDIEAPGVARGTLEMATLTCAHCNRVVVLNPLRQRERCSCRKCDAYVCDSPGCNAECNPFMQSVELARKYQGDQSYLLRGPRGEILFDPERRDRERPYLGVTLPGPGGD